MAEAVTAWFLTRGGGIVLALILSPLVGAKAGAEPSGWMIVALQMPTWILTLVAIQWLGGLAGAPTPRLGLSRPALSNLVATSQLRFRPIDLLWGLLGGFGLHYGVSGLYWVIEQFAGKVNVDRPAREMVTASPGWLTRAGLLLAIVVLAPLTEEMFYRGVAQRAAVSQWGPALGIVATSGLFGLAHFQGTQLPGLVLVGAVLGVISWRTGRIGGAVVAHAVFNALSLINLFGLRI